MGWIVDIHIHVLFIILSVISVRGPLFLVSIGVQSHWYQLRNCQAGTYASTDSCVSHLSKQESRGTGPSMAKSRVTGQAFSRSVSETILIGRY
jgi:hypothetical protein